MLSISRLGAALLGNILSKSSERNFFSDIYQNCSSGYSATILLVATKTPLPAAPTIPSPPFSRSLLWASPLRHYHKLMKTSHTALLRGRCPAVMGSMHSPRSGGGPISLLMGEPPGLVPGGRGKCMDPITANTGGVPRPRGDRGIRGGECDRIPGSSLRRPDHEKSAPHGPRGPMPPPGRASQSRS